MTGVEFLLDTNVLIGLLKAHPPALSLLGQELEPLGRSAYSAITRMELLGYPGLQPAERRAIEQLLAVLTYLPIDTPVEDRAIAIRAGPAEAAGCHRTCDGPVP